MIQYSIIAGTIGTCLLISIYDITYNNMDFNKFVTIQVLLSQTFVPIQFIGGMFNQIFRGLQDISDLCQLLKVSDKIMDKDNATTLNAKTSDNSGYIEFKNVFFE